MISFTCPQCGKSVKAPDNAAGKKARCPHCKSITLIPSAEPESDNPFAAAIAADLAGKPVDEPLPPVRPSSSPVPARPGSFRASSASGRIGRKWGIKRLILLALLAMGIVGAIFAVSKAWQWYNTRNDLVPGLVLDLRLEGFPGNTDDERLVRELVQHGLRERYLGLPPGCITPGSGLTLQIRVRQTGTLKAKDIKLSKFSNTSDQIDIRGADVPVLETQMQLLDSKGQVLGQTVGEVRDDFSHASFPRPIFVKSNLKGAEILVSQVWCSSLPDYLTDHMDLPSPRGNIAPRYPGVKSPKLKQQEETFERNGYGMRRDGEFIVLWFPRDSHMVSPGIRDQGKPLDSQEFERFFAISQTAVQLRASLALYRKSHPGSVPASLDELCRFSGVEPTSLSLPEGTWEMAQVQAWSSSHGNHILFYCTQPFFREHTWTIQADGRMDPTIATVVPARMRSELRSREQAAAQTQRAAEDRAIRANRATSPARPRPAPKSRPSLSPK